MEITEDQAQTKRKKRRQRENSFEPAAPVGGTSSIDMFYFLLHFIVGLVPCYPVCQLLPTFVLLFAPLPAFPWSGFLPLLLLSPLPPFPWALPTTHGGCAALPTQLCLIPVPPHHEPFGYFEDPPVPPPRLFRVDLNDECFSVFFGIFPKFRYFPEIYSGKAEKLHPPKSRLEVFRVFQEI